MTASNATDQPSASAPRRSRGFLRSQLRMLVGTLLLVAAAGLAVLPHWLSSPARVSRLVADLLPELQADVTFGGVRLGWLGPLVLDDVRLVPRDGGAAPVKIRRVGVSNGLLGILFSVGDLGRIRVEGLEADVVFDAERRSNLAGLFAAEDVAAQPAPAGPGPAARRSVVRLRIDVEDAIVRLAGPWSAEPWVSDPIDIRGALGPSPDGDFSEWTIEPVQLLTQARLEPGVAQGVLAYIAPVLADATRTGGRFSLRLDGAKLPVGRPEDGTLAGRLSMHEVVLGPGPLAVETLASLPLKLPPPPTILLADEADVDFRLADRRVWHKGLEFGLPLAKPGQRLDIESSGSVGLDAGDLDLVLRLPIPADLPQDRPLLAALSGKQISLGIGGHLGEPQVKFDGSIKAAAGEVFADLVDQFREKRQAAPPGRPTPGDAVRSIETGDATGDAVVDLVGGVLDEVAKRRAERRAAEAANPDAVPPRRGGLLRRLANPPPAEPSPANPPPPAPGGGEK